VSAALLVAAAAWIGASPPGASAARPPVIPTSVVHYDSSTLDEYHQKWSNIYGPLDGATESFDNGAFHVRDVPFKTGTDFSVFDHLKYMAVSNQTFDAPQRGSIAFSVDIKAETPGTAPGHVVHGQYGPPGSYDAGNTAARRYASMVLEGQQAGVVLNMIDYCSGQLFDWFVSSGHVFPLIERLPTTITGNTSNPNCPGASEVALDKAYTQIVKDIPVTPGATHNVAIVYSQAAGHSNVTYLLDGLPVATVNNVGVPLDKQGVPYTGIYPSLGRGEQLAGKIRSFSIGHGLFSLLDAFPFQYGCTPPSASGPGVCDPAYAKYSVSIPASERAFGQGADGSFSHFTVRTVGS
jgi:hypothetical protein